MKKLMMALMLMPIMALARTSYGNEVSDRDSTTGASALPAKASAKKITLKFSSATKKLAKTPAKAKLGKSFSLSLGLVSSAGLAKVTAKGLPNGLSINKKTGKITGKPTKSGKHTAKVTVKDVAGNVISQKVKITVCVPSNIKGTYYGCTCAECSAYYYDDNNSLKKKKFYDMCGESREVKVTVSSVGKVSAKVGTYSFSGGMLSFSDGHYAFSGHAKDASRFYFEIDPLASWTEDSLKGEFVIESCRGSGGCVGNPDTHVFARKNAAKTNAEAKKAAARCAKLGSQVMYVTTVDAASVNWYGEYADYALECKACCNSSLCRYGNVYIKTDKNGKATLSGTIAGTAINGTAYLQYHHQGKHGEVPMRYHYDMACARFFIGRFVIYVGFLSYNDDFKPSEYDTQGIAWKKW